MNNYTVDVSIFLLNEDEFLKADEKGKGTLVKNVCRAIDKYGFLCKSLENSVFFPKFNTSEFLQKLKNNAFRKYHEEIEQLLGDGVYQYHDYKIKLQNIIDNYQIEDGEHLRDWREDFNNQFYIQQITLNKADLIEEPDNDIHKTIGENFTKTLASIALLNRSIYGNSSRQLFLYKGLTKHEELRVNIGIKDIVIDDNGLRKIIGKPGEFIGTVNKKSYKTIKETPKKFKTLEEAVKQAQNDFPNLIFGNEIERSVKERGKDAGPPDKVYYYLKTLSEITESKKTVHPDFSLVLLARMYGCNCSGQSKEIMYDDGEGTSGFVDHLKPAESQYRYVDRSDDGNCIRIFFKWSGQKGKTIVGWIGKHQD